MLLKIKWLWNSKCSCKSTANIGIFMAWKQTDQPQAGILTHHEPQAANEATRCWGGDLKVHLYKRCTYLCKSCSYGNTHVSACEYMDFLLPRSVRPLKNSSLIPLKRVWHSTSCCFYSSELADDLPSENIKETSVGYLLLSSLLILGKINRRMRCSNVLHIMCCQPAELDYLSSWMTSPTLSNQWGHCSKFIFKVLFLSLFGIIHQNWRQGVISLLTSGWHKFQST